MSRVRLFAEAIKQGVSNPEEVKRDLAALLASFSQVEANNLLADIQDLLDGNDGALTLLSEVNTLSSTTTADAFGPVIAGSPAAVERLALLVDFLYSNAQNVILSKIDDFVESSTTDTKVAILELFSIAKSVNDILTSPGSTPIQRFWASETVPRLFQVTLKNSELLLDFTISATGGELSGEWKPIEDWIKQWWDRWRTRNPDINTFDGFFQPLKYGYQPAVIHPLEIRILRQSILGETSEVINSFSNWIIKNIFDKTQRLPNIVPESVFASGAFILEMARQNRLDNADSTKEQVLNIIVENSEQTANTPQSWQGQRERIHELFNACPDWYESSTLEELRNRAGSRFNEQFDKLKIIIPQQSNEIPNEFLPPAELVAIQRLEDFRPNTSIVDAINTSIDQETPIDPVNGKFAQFIDPQWQTYITKIKETEVNLVQAEQNEEKVRDISQTTQQQIATVQGILESPLAESAFVNSVFGQVFDNAALATYSRQKSSQLFLENTIGTNGSKSFESLDTQTSWINIVNQTTSDTDTNGILQAWAKLETWDSWRGRLAKTDDNIAKRFNLVKNVAPSLLTTLSAANLDGVNLDEIRPQFAAIVHLGIKHDGDLFKDLVARLETWLVSGNLSTDQQSLLAATRLELGLTAISADIAPIIAFQEFGKDRTALQKLAGWITNAVNSKNVWESRAGMHMLILSSRLAEETGDVWIETVLRTAIANAPKAKTLVNESINALSNNTGTGQFSGLPLALAGFNLQQYSREKARSIGITQEPEWLSGQNPVTLIDDIAKRFTKVNRQALQRFAAEGGVAGKILLLTIFQIKLDELQRQRQLIVKPIQKDSEGKELVSQLRGLKKTLRSVFCSEEIILRGFPADVETIFISGPVNIGDTWTITLDTQSITYTATEASIQNVVAGLTEAWNISDFLSNNKIEASGLSQQFELEVEIQGVLEKVKAGIINLEQKTSVSDFSVTVETNSAQGKIERLSGITEQTPWWQAQYWSTLSIQNPDIPKEPLDQPQPDVAFAEELEQQIFSPALKDALNADFPPDKKLSNNAIARVQIPQKQWLILDEEEAYLIKKETETATNLSVAKVTAPFHLFNWSEAYHNNIESTLLSLAATLEASVPIISEQEEKDIDGKFEGEFPEPSWKIARERLQKAIAKLEESEEKYKEAIETQLSADQNEEIIELLKQPLLINTADYREQIQVAIADLRKSEAELEVAEREALAAEFETFASELLYEAAEVEVERQNALEEISKLDEEIAEFNRQAEEIRQRQAETNEEIANKNVDLALNLLEQAKVQKRKAERARAAILQEIELLKKVMGTDPPDPEFEVTVTLPDGRQEKANGQIAAMAIKIEDSLMSQLRTDLDQAKKDLKKAKDKERERKKKAKRRRWIKAACRFVGAVVGGVIGGPAGVALGAQIGEAVGELTNGIIENKPPGEILVGLIDNGFAIAKAAGVNLEQELNTLGAKGAVELNQFFTEIDSSLGPILDSLPNVLDEQLFKDAIEILDLEEVPQLTDLLTKSYGDLKTDINNLGNLGTELKDLFTDQGNKEAIGFSNSRELLDKLTGKIFDNTKDNVEQIEALAKSIGEEIEDIRTNPARQLEIAQSVADKVGKLVITQIGQEAGEYKRQVLSTWIRQKRISQATWDAVRAEGELLLQELFSDSEVRTEVLSNMELSLLDENVLQGKIQVLLDPWQAELDQRLKDITEIDKNAPKPKTAVQAAQQRVTYLENCIKQFEEKLIPWLKGENNNERAQLLLELAQKLKDDLDATDNIEIKGFDVAAARINKDIAESELIKAEQRLLEVGKLYQIVEIKVSRASLQSKVVSLAKLKSDKVKNAQGNSLKAAEQKYKAAQARIKAVQFNIQSKQAGLEAATVRGAEASKVRAVLSQPPLRLPKLAQSDITKARLSHLVALEKAFSAYREQVRYIQAAGAKPPELNLPTLANANTSWSSVFSTFNNRDWNKNSPDPTSIGNILDDSVFVAEKLGAPQPASEEFTWELSPEQIQSLFTPEGFRVIVTPQAELEPTIFTVGLEWQKYLDELIKLNNNSLSTDEKKKIEQEFRPGFNKLWVEQFNKYGIPISKNVSIEKDGADWKITDNQIKDVIISYKRDSDGSLITISDIKEPNCYSIKKIGDKLFATRRYNRLSELGRSSFQNYYHQLISKQQAKTGRISALFLVGEINDGNFLRENDFEIKVEHLGDFYTIDSNNQLRIQLRRKRAQRENKDFFENRDFFVDKGTDLRERLEKEVKFFKGQGDPDPYGIQGIPLSGTTIIRLEPLTGTKFKKLTLQVLFSFFS